MRTVSTFLFILLATYMMQCKQHPENLQVKVERRITVDYISSGSGMVLHQDSLFIVGDDSPYLFRLSHSFEAVGKYLISPGQKTQKRIPKPVKPDFESMVKEDSDQGTFLYSFGSGSLSPQRDTLLVLNINQPDEYEKFNITAFYKHIMETAGIASEDFNIEGAVIHQEYLFIFNRGNNTVIKVNWHEFKNYLHNSTDVNIPIELFPIRLPEIGDKLAGFSGACLLPDSQYILFTATAENTENWIDDGEILGSYVGVLNIEAIAEGTVEIIAPIFFEEQITKDKVESIAFRRCDENGDILAYAIADNDNGTSKLLALRLSGFRP